MSSAMKAAIHLGPNYTENLEVFKNTNFEEIQSLFGITQKLILDHSEEILNVKPIESTAPSWTRSILSHDQVISGQKQKYVFTQTLFYALGSCQILQKQTEDGKAKWQTFKCPLLKKNCWESMENTIEFEWNIFPGLKSLQILPRIQNDLQERNSELVKIWRAN